MRASRSYYDILGVLPNASAAVLRLAHLRLLRQAHPDMGGSSALLDLVNEAYDTLKDPASRTRYDAALSRGVGAAGLTSPGPRSPQPAPAQPTPPQPTPSRPRDSRTGQPPTGVPRSQSGRVPQWVVDEALGQPPHAVPWRGAYSPTQDRRSVPRRRRAGRLATTLAVLTVLAIFGAAAWTNGWLSSLTAGNSYRFARFQADGTTPVTYDRCRPIHYVIRQTGAPEGGPEVVRSAVLRISEATGLRFVYDGTTSEAPSHPRQMQQPGRYASHWAPVLIAWVTPADPELGDDAAGAGGSSSIGLPNQGRAYVTGAVQLDAAYMSGLLKRTNGKDLARGIVLHELGHVVGLDHIDDDTQLMYPRARPGVTDFGSGDLNGLAALGKGTCQSGL